MKLTCLRREKITEGVGYLVEGYYIDARETLVKSVCVCVCVCVCVYTNIRHRKILGVKKCYNMVSDG